MEVVNDESIWQKTNVGHSEALGFELSGNWDPIRLLSIGFSGNVYRDEIDGRTVGYDAKKSMVCTDLKGSHNFQYHFYYGITAGWFLYFRSADTAGESEKPQQCECRAFPVFYES